MTTASLSRKRTSPGLWALAWLRLRRDRPAMAALTVMTVYVVLLILSAMGIVAGHWDAEVGVNYAPPAIIGAQSAEERGVPGLNAAQADVPENPRDPLRAILRRLRAERAAEGSRAGPGSAAATTAGRRATLLFGADRWGHDIIQKTIKGSQTSITVGFAAALLATVLGTLLGALSGYYGTWVDDFFNWFYSVFTSVPYLLLILAVAAVLQRKGVMTIVLILGLTGWTGVYRLIRAEYIKHKGREYVMAADAIGAGNASRMFRHIFPNVSHVAFVQMSVLTVSFIKSEVILSFLGFGVPVGVASWGSMLNEAQNELLLGKWWQLTAATAAMAVLVTAFSIFTDALRDALDPKLK